jgi:hypothetical protein
MIIEAPFALGRAVKVDSAETRRGVGERGKDDLEKPKITHFAKIKKSLGTGS